MRALLTPVASTVSYQFQALYHMPCRAERARRAGRPAGCVPHSDAAPTLVRKRAPLVGGTLSWEQQNKALLAGVPPRLLLPT